MPPHPCHSRGCRLAAAAACYAIDVWPSHRVRRYSQFDHYAKAEGFRSAYGPHELVIRMRLDLELGHPMPIHRLAGGKRGQQQHTLRDAYAWQETLAARGQTIQQWQQSGQQQRQRQGPHHGQGAEEPAEEAGREQAEHEEEYSIGLQLATGKRMELERIRAGIRSSSGPSPDGDLSDRSFSSSSYRHLDVGAFGSFGTPPRSKSTGRAEVASPAYVRCTPEGEAPNAHGNPMGDIKPPCPPAGSTAAGGREAVWMWSDWFFIGSPAAMHPLAQMTSLGRVLSRNSTRCFGLCQEEQTSLHLQRAGVRLVPLRLPLTIRKLSYHPWPCSGKVDPPLLDSADLQALHISNWYAACPPPLAPARCAASGW